MNDTIVALATPAGEGALGLIRLSGSEAISIVDDIFLGAKLANAQSHTIHFGKIMDDKEVIDECLTFLFKGPNTYTGEDVVEISCHGSSYIIQSILQLAIKSGARMAQPGEFTQRAFLYGKMDLSQAEAVADLINSRSKAAHNMAMQQLGGQVSNQIKQLRQRLVDLASLMELELDFSEEDVEFADRTQFMALIEELQSIAAKLIYSFQWGNAIKSGVSTVIAGAPNAGKSTLLNVLLEEERAIVSDIPGTTRDTIEEVMTIDGIQFRFIDTAGIRQSVDTIEQEGVSRSHQKIASSAILLYVFDVATTTPEKLEEELADIKLDDRPYVLIANKMDRNPYAKMDWYAEVGFDPEQMIPISAKNNMNIEFLKERLLKLIQTDQLDPNLPIISSARHHGILLQLTDHLQAIQQGFHEQIPTDLIALDVRAAIQSLGEITGEITTDDLLGNIFSKFCIGK